MGRAEVVRTAQALLALHASVERFDDHGGAVLADAGELVAEDLPASRSRCSMRSDSAHAGRPHLEELAGARWFLDVDDDNATVGRAHLPSSSAPDRRALLDERRRAFLGVLAGEHDVLPVRRRARAARPCRTTPSRTSSFTRRAPRGALAAIRSASASAASSTSSGATTALTRPSSYARAASIRSPVSVISSAIAERDPRPEERAAARREQAALHLGQPELAPRDEATIDVAAEQQLEAAGHRRAVRRARRAGS